MHARDFAAAHLGHIIRWFHRLTVSPSRSRMPSYPAMAPRNIDIKKDRGITIEWEDGSTSYYSVAYLRRMSPSAEMRELRQQQQRNPLTVLPSRGAGGAGRRPGHHR
jgi:hypothetical protein